MDADLRRQLDQVWELERADVGRRISQEVQRANEQAKRSGILNDSTTAAILSQALVPFVDERAVYLIDEIRKVFAAHGNAPAQEERAELVEKFKQTMILKSSDARTAVNGLKGPRAISLIDPTAQELTTISAKRTHEIEVMLISLGTNLVRKNVAAVNVTNSNVQFGDNNLQVNQITIFRDIVAKIDASSAAPAAKEEAKGLLAKFLEHPVTAAVASGMSAAVFSHK